MLNHGLLNKHCSPISFTNHIKKPLCGLLQCVNSAMELLACRFPHLPLYEIGQPQRILINMSLKLNFV